MVTFGIISSGDIGTMDSDIGIMSSGYIGIIDGAIGTIGNEINTIILLFHCLFVSHLVKLVELSKYFLLEMSEHRLIDVTGHLILSV